MHIPNIDTAYMIDFLTGLLNTPSPTGYSEAAIAYIRIRAEFISGTDFFEDQKRRSGCPAGRDSGMIIRAL